MPIRPPALDDRSFADLVEEVLSRIPAHSPEYTNPRLGDPGRTMVELFAWLTDALLYRANLVPEKQRLAFLRLLGLGMRPAQAARGVVGLKLDDELPQAVTVQALATIKGAVPFETRNEITLVPITAEGFYKRALSEPERHVLGPLQPKLALAYGMSLRPGQHLTGYVTTPVFAGGAAAIPAFNLLDKKNVIDGSLWLALLAPKKELVDACKQALGKGVDGQQVLLSLGIVPNQDIDPLASDVGTAAHIPHVWEVSTGKEINGEPEYATCDEVEDSTAGLTRAGVVRIELPAASRIGALPNNPRDLVDGRPYVQAGTGDRPPRLDDAQMAAKLVCWLRLRPADTSVTSLSLSWIGVNGAEIDQRTTIPGAPLVPGNGRIVGTSNGLANQVVQLPGLSVEASTLRLQVEEPGQGFLPWQLVDDVLLAGPLEPVFSLDSEAGTVTFGDGLRGKIPAAGMRYRVALLRSGGGSAGNLAPGTLADVTAYDDANNRLTRRLKVVQSLPTWGGQDSETLAQAEQRIPAYLRHRDRAVTSDDFKQLAADTPAVAVGRVELLTGFKPQQKRTDIPGVVSVMVLPYADVGPPPNPRVDRPFIEQVFNQLDPKRPLATELYVIGCEYKPVGVSVGVTLRKDAPREQTLLNVKLALRRFLWPLMPGGPDATGWPLKRPVKNRELEVVVAQVPGVLAVLGVNIFDENQAGTNWELVKEKRGQLQAEIDLLDWQLPELLACVVVADEDPPDNLDMLPNPFAPSNNTGAVPVVPEVC